MAHVQLWTQAGRTVGTHTLCLGSAALRRAGRGTFPSADVVDGKAGNWRNQPTLFPREISYRRREKIVRKEEESDFPTVAAAKDVQAHPGGGGRKFTLQ